MALTQKKDQAGFGTLETLILTLIIAILVFVTAYAFAGARAAQRDAQRVSDAQQLQKALKYYFEEFGRFPSASSGRAVGVDNSFSRFVPSWPEPPWPADGTCTEASNRYAYTEIDAGENYQIKFCLGEDSQGLKAGPHTATPEGIQ
jgi:type II secretory pathway pseudopilin PulG